MWVKDKVKFAVVGMGHIGNRQCLAVATVSVGATATLLDRARMKISRDKSAAKGIEKRTASKLPGATATKTAAPKRKRATVGRPRKGDGSVVAADRILDAAEDLFSNVDSMA